MSQDLYLIMPQPMPIDPLSHYWIKDWLVRADSAEDAAQKANRGWELVKVLNLSEAPMFRVTKTCQTTIEAVAA